MSSQLITFFLCIAARVTGLYLLVGGFQPILLAGPSRSPYSAFQGDPSLSLRMVSEYAPQKKVLISSHLFQAPYHAPELVEEILKAGSEVVVIEAEEGHKIGEQLRTQGIPLGSQLRVVSIPHRYPWLRDFGPIVARQGSEGKNIFFDLDYPEPGESLHDRFPSAIGQVLQIDVKQIPIPLDGGNLLMADEICVSSLNEKAPDGVGPILAKDFGCKSQVFLKNPPHVHVDMYVKLLPGRVALVSQLVPKTRSLWEAQTGFFPDEFVELATKLDGAAQQLAQHFKVIRIPMPVPYRGGFRSYTNSIIVNKTIIAPSFRKFGWGQEDYPDSSLAPFYEREVRRIYQASGYKVSFVNSDALIYNGGSFHCVLLQIP